jgi:hypothetical protein
MNNTANKLNDITEITGNDGLQLLDKNETTVFTDDEKAKLTELIDEIFPDEIDENEINTLNDPQVLFAKFLWRIKYLEDEIGQYKSTAEKLIQEIETWLAHKSNQKQSQIEFLSGRMEEYLRTREIKSMSLPAGLIGLRKQQDKIEITNEELFYEKADANLIRKIPETQEPDLKKIKEQIKQTGEVPDGVDVVSQESKFYYKLN